MSLSIIIPTIDQNELTSILKKCSSFKSNNKIEFIIINQSSKFIKLDKTYRNIFIFNYLVPIGLSNARNIGAYLSKKNKLAFIDGDIFILIDDISLLINKIIENIFDFATCSIISNNKILGKSISYNYLKKNDFKNFYGGVIFARRELFLQYRFNCFFGRGALFKACEETELFFRLIKDKVKIRILNITLKHIDNNFIIQKHFEYRASFGSLFYTIIFSNSYDKSNSRYLLYTIFGELILSPLFIMSPLQAVGRFLGFFLFIYGFLSHLFLNIKSKLN